MEFLGQVQKLQKDPDTAVSICPKVLMYKDKDTKSSRVRAAKRDGANTLDVNGEGTQQLQPFLFFLSFPFPPFPSHPNQAREFKRRDVKKNFGHSL